MQVMVYLKTLAKHWLAAPEESEDLRPELSQRLDDLINSGDEIQVYAHLNVHVKDLKHFCMHFMMKIFLLVRMPASWSANTKAKMLSDQL